MAKFTIEVSITNAVTYIGTLEIEAYDEEAAHTYAVNAVRLGEVEFKPEDDEAVTISGPEFCIFHED